uniref:REJ domain-containing protein n=1 Tax=viral metagenome TaxID=1070528 RepID=A0A6H1ZIH8_9ZZZZ
MVTKNRLFTLSRPKPIASEWFVLIDLSDWLGTEEISSVTFSAKRKANGTNATSEVINSTNSTNTTTVIKPFIKGGKSGETYVVTMKVTTNGSPASVEEFYLEFRVSDNIPNIG